MLINWVLIILSTSYFCPRISRIYTNFPVLFTNGDLFGRTNHTNAITKASCWGALLELVRFVRPYRSPFNSLGTLRVDSWDSWATKKLSWAKIVLSKQVYSSTNILIFCKDCARRVQSSLLELPSRRQSSAKIVRQNILSKKNCAFL